MIEFKFMGETLYCVYNNMVDSKVRHMANMIFAFLYHEKYNINADELETIEIIEKDIREIVNEFEFQRTFINKSEHNEIINKMNAYLVARRLTQ